MLTHKPATDKLIEDFLADVLQPYIDKGTVPTFINQVLAPYAMAWPWFWRYARHEPQTATNRRRPARDTN